MKSTLSDIEELEEMIEPAFRRCVHTSVPEMPRRLYWACAEYVGKPEGETRYLMWWGGWYLCCESHGDEPPLWDVWSNTLSPVGT